jgi:hypothetical protein
LALVLATALPGRALIAVDGKGPDSDRPPSPRIERVERFYDVAELIDKLAERSQVSADAATQALIQRLTDESTVVEFADKTRLRVLAPAATHIEIPARLKAWQNGFSERVEIQAKVLQMPEAKLLELLESQQSQPADSKVGIDRFGQEPAPSPGNQARVAVPSAGAPVRKKILTGEAADAFWSGISEMPGVEMISRPKILAISGQCATIEIQSTAPESESRESSNHELKTAPAIEVFRMDLVPAVQSDSRIQMAATFQLSQTRGVKQPDASNTGMSNGEQPDVVSGKIQATAVVAPKETLLLGFSVRDRRSAFLVALVPMPVPESQAVAAPPERSSSQVISPPAMTSFSATGDRKSASLSLSGWTLKIDSHVDGDQQAKLNLQSRDNRLTVYGSGRVQLKLGSPNTDPAAPAVIELQAGELHVTEFVRDKSQVPPESRRRLALELKSRVSLRTTSFDVTCDEALLDVTLPTIFASPAAIPSPRLHLKLSGNVHLENKSTGSGNGASQLQAEHLTISTEPDAQVNFSVSSLVTNPEPENDRGRSHWKRSLKHSDLHEKTNLAGNNPLVIRNYPVADLGIPLPELVTIPLPVVQASQTIDDFRLQAGQGLRLSLPSSLKRIGPLPLALEFAFPTSVPQPAYRIGLSSAAASQRPSESSAAAPGAAAATSSGEKDPAGAGTPATPDELPTKPAVDLEPLQKLIESQVAPKSWEGRGGPGSIMIYEKTHSLVIRQTPEVHQQIATLLSGLRREMDLQISLELKLVRFTDQNWWKTLTWIEKPETLFDGLSLSQAHALEFGMLNQVEKQSSATRLPKVTVFNEQVAEFSLPLSRDSTVKPLAIGMSASIDNDRRGLRLNLVCNASSREEALTGARSFRLGAGQSLLIDLGRDAALLQESESIPMLNKIPHLGRLFRYVNSRPQTGEKAPALILLVTPRIIVLDEEEELLAPPAKQ